MNELKVHLQQAIVALHEQGWSNRKIARELSLDRGTVRKYLLAAPKPCEGGAAAFSKPAISLTGSAADSPPKPAISLTGSSGAGRHSLCENWRAQIEAATQAGLSAQRIYQDLVVEHQFEGSYHSVQRFVQRLKGAEPLPFRRLECEAGAEAQVDFGQGAWVVENGRRNARATARRSGGRRRRTSSAAWKMRFVLLAAPPKRR